mmetsp:Transcript_4977/g.11401  ORF Transcript_4977/g.11401 Transcript_4977/m.11401 type:complete len:308 (+) Transcript_4977:2291-3214(+)
MVRRHAHSALQRVGPRAAHDGRAFLGDVADLRGAEVGDHFDLPRRDEEVGREADLPLERWARGEVARPVSVWVVAERPDVVGAHLVAALPLLLLVCVAGGRRVEGVDAAVEVDVVDELVEVAVPVVGVLELEVCATRPHLVRRQRVVVLLDRVLHELVHPLVGVVVVEARVVVDLLGRAVEVHPGRVAAVTRAVEVACEDLRRAAERLRALPDPLEARVALLLGAAHVAVLPVHPPPVEGLEPRLCPKQPRLRVRVAEGVDLPRRARRRVGAEVLKDELVAARRLVDHRRPQRRGLVVHAPAAVGEL